MNKICLWKKRSVIAALLVILMLLLLIISGQTGRKERTMKIQFDSPLKITSPAFSDNGWIPVEYTGYGIDLSPELHIDGIAEGAESMVVVLDDLDIPLVGVVNHWIIWNLPVQTTLPKGIAHGKNVGNLGGAVQGIGYGKHCYRGPKPPFFIRSPHRYRFTVYTLDCKLELDESSRKKDLLKAMDGHVLQSGSLMGKYRN